MNNAKVSSSISKLSTLKMSPSIKQESSNSNETQIKIFQNDNQQNITDTEFNKCDKKSIIPTDSSTRVQIQQYLHTVSGQLKKSIIQELEHNYAKPCHIHPDPQIHSHAAKFLFMKHFPQHLTKLGQQSDEDVDVISYEEPKKIPFLTPKPIPSIVTVDENIPEIDSSITDSWTCEKNKLWTRATKIINSDRIARLSFEGHANEILLKRNLQEHTANKFRELFASTFWDLKLITWLHNTFLEYLNPNYLAVYIESLQILRQKIPTLIEKFYSMKTENKNKPIQNDPLFNTLSHYKPKKLPRKPIFIFVPSGPNQTSTLSPRLRYWNSLFSSMGKLISLYVPASPNDYISDILTDIRCLVNDKIKSCKNSFANRPIILVGFNSGSTIAAHCALQNPKLVCAVVCLGFSLKTINGSRGELGDTLLELTSPIQFIIGENSVMTSLDDMEDFRERMTRTETSLIVVGGADDKLMVSNVKKRLECLTQSMVDRCIADEIYSFLSTILINYNEEPFSLNDSPRHFKFFHDEHGQQGLAQKKKSRKRSKTNDLIVFNSNNTGAILFNNLSEKPATKRKKTIQKPKKDINETSKINNPMISSNFTIVPFHSQLSPNLATIMNSDNPEKPMFTTIKIEKSKIISIDNQPILPLTTFAKKVVKKTVSSPSIHTNLNNLKTVFSCIKNEEINCKSNQLVTNTEMKNGLSSANVSTFTKNSSSSNSTFTTTATTVDPKTNIGFTEVASSVVHPGSTRTGRQIKPPKALDF